VFECYIEREELYKDDDYWVFYERWFYENEIKTFNEWYHDKFQEKEIPYLKDKRIFWDAYDDYDYETLEALTNGKFANLQNQYRDYLFSTDYESFNDWKFQYNFEKDYITLKNTGEYMSDARLHIYTYLMYYLKIGDYDPYTFVIDMGDDILSEFWNGTYFTNSAYDSGNNAFYIEYIQNIQGNKDEYLKLENLEDFIMDEDTENNILNAIGVDVYNTDVFLGGTYLVYFAIEYLDIEQKKQTDWYRYDIKSNTLYNVETYSSDVQVPDFAKEAFTDAYYEAETLYIAETLGYQNAQWRPFYELDGDYSYIEEAKEKMISDLKKLVNDM